ncbi:MAG: recombinase family protein [Eubacteriales bacterium]
MARVSRKNLARNENNNGGKTVYVVGVYIRLSNEDERKKENKSAESQKKMVLDFLDKLDNAELHEVYEDINFSGTNFHRPAFEKMIEDVKAKKINCIIVKDLSRFGRNYLEVGNFLEFVFPFLNVRFISVNDGYDTLYNNTSADIAIPIKNLMNEMYARDISKKIRSQRHIDVASGNFTASTPPYGYLLKNKKLVVDKVTSPTVNEIFQYAMEGKGILAIIQILNAKGYKPPAVYFKEIGVIKAEGVTKSELWGRTTIRRMLANEIYIGNIVSGYRSRSKFVDYSEGNEIIRSEGVHEAIISKEVFDIVNGLRNARKALSKKQIDECLTKPTANIFKGLIFCVDCKRPMFRTRRQNKIEKERYVFHCPTNELMSKEHCKRKYIDEEIIVETVWSVLNIHFMMFLEIENEGYKQTTKEVEKQLHALKIKLKSLQGRLNNIFAIQRGLYDDYKDEILSADEFARMKHEYNKEAERIKDENDSVEAQIALLLQKAKDKNNPYEIIRNFIDNKELDIDMLNALIEKIEVDSENDIKVTLKYGEEIKYMYDKYSMQKEGVS